MNEPPNYQSYLLRLWRDNPRAPWQASLQSTATEQIHHFADVDRMWAFLKAQMEGEAEGPEAGHPIAGESEPGAPA